jgi:mannose-6-phosphate isomerase
MTDALLRAADRCVAWSLDRAAPLWAENGFDHRLGRFAERLADPDAAATRDPTRTIVQARQIYSFCVLGRMGWSGPWRSIVEGGLAYLRTACQGADGAYVYSTAPNGAIADSRLDLYTHAFVIFALAHVARDCPEKATACEAEALRVLTLLRQRLSAPAGGFRDARDGAFLQTNPHMHLFEAGLAWSGVSGRTEWRSLVSEIGALALDKFIVRPDGALREFFNQDWSPADGDSGLAVEPGHQFEWAWLLTRWGDAFREPEAYAAAGALAEFAEARGVDRKRRTAVQIVRADGAPIDYSSRLWPQTERLKAQLILANRAHGLEQVKREAAALESVNALFGYFDAATPGLWRDRLSPEGAYREEAAPASSFYHILCAFEELQNAARRQPQLKAS